MPRASDFEIRLSITRTSAASLHGKRILHSGPKELQPSSKGQSYVWAFSTRIVAEMYVICAPPDEVMAWSVACTQPAVWVHKGVQRRSAMELFTQGIDLAKTTFHLVGMNQRGEVAVRQHRAFTMGR